MIHRDCLLVGDGVGRVGPMDRDLVGCQIVVGSGVALLLLVLVEDDPDDDTVASGRCKLGSDGGVGQFVHSHIYGLLGRGDQGVDGG